MPDVSALPDIVFEEQLEDPKSTMWIWPGVQPASSKTPLSPYTSVLSSRV